MDSLWCGSVSSEVFPLSLSGGGGLLLSTGSRLLVVEQQDSDDEKSSTSLLEDSMACSGSGSDHDNSLKKAPGWQDSPAAIKPPPEFQDSSPTSTSPVDEIRSFPEWLEKMAARIVSEVLEEALSVSWSRRRRRPFPPCWVPSLPGSRSSLSSRLSSSHNSLSVPMANRADDSSFITSAMSHDVLSMGDISDMYNVPIDCDVYAVPVDTLRPSAPVPPDRPKRHRHRRTRRYMEPDGPPIVIPTAKRPGRSRSSSMECTTPVEPIHMTLQEVRRYLHNLYSSSSDSSEYQKKRNRSSQLHHNGHWRKSGDDRLVENESETMPTSRIKLQTHRKATLTINVKNKRSKNVCSANASTLSSPECLVIPDSKPKKQGGRGFSLSLSLKQTFCNIFRFGRMVSPEQCVSVSRSSEGKSLGIGVGVAGSGASPPVKAHLSKRALPPLPAREGVADAPDDSTPPPRLSPTPEDTLLAIGEAAQEDLEPSVDFASSIEKVKDYGWYWGPISGEAAEKILSTEPDGSFIVRDSSDDHYIFSLTFKLNSCVRHVRIEQDQGNFSFGSCAKFKSHTIVDFIENAVEHSRSGRYLFFLHRRPVLGPMRVQLLHPVSRFKQVQSLQHMCRFVILKVVRRDLISTLPLPRRLVDYLNTPHYYSEQLAEEAANRSPSPSLGDQGIVPYMSPNTA